MVARENRNGFDAETPASADSGLAERLSTPAASGSTPPAPLNVASVTPPREIERFSQWRYARGQLADCAAVTAFTAREGRLGRRCPHFRRYRPRRRRYRRLRPRHRSGRQRRALAPTDVLAVRGQGRCANAFGLASPASMSGFHDRVA